jgi:hypothetical protein
MTSPTIEGRILGASRYFSVPNLLNFIFTGNGATISPDLRRRLAIVELFLPEAKAEEHVFRNSLTIEDIINQRSDILSALWALVRTWSDAGCPGPTSSDFFGYHQWAQTILGILEFHGWTQFKPIPTKLEHSGDRQTLAMQGLLKVMTKNDPYTFEQIVNEARDNDLFDWILPGQNSELKPDARSSFGKLLNRYNNRTFLIQKDKDDQQNDDKQNPQKEPEFDRFKFIITQQNTRSDSRRFTKSTNFAEVS